MLNLGVVYRLIIIMTVDFLKFEKDMMAFLERKEFDTTESNCIKEFAKNLINGTNSFVVEWKYLRNNSVSAVHKIWHDPILRREFKSILLRYNIREEIIK